MRRGFYGYHVFRPGWRVRYPWARYAARWTAAAVWTSATWAAVNSWWGSAYQPVYYDYGNTIVYEGDTVYVDGQEAGTAEEYYQQASELAYSRQVSEEDLSAETDEDWLPLGVFALVEDKPGEERAEDEEITANMMFQLTVSKGGVIRGTFYNVLSGNAEPVQGSVDMESQRAAWTIGDNGEVVVETGISNLTEDEAPALVHFGPDRTQQMLLVRLEYDEAASAEE